MKIYSVKVEDVKRLQKDEEESFTVERFEVANEVLSLMLHEFDTKIDNALKFLRNQGILRDDEDEEIFLTLLSENFQARNEIRILNNL